MKKLSLDALGRITVGEYRDAKKLPVTIVLDNLRSLHNVGSAFRTADAFLIEKIILTGITGTPPHREIQKTALGATESVPWEYIESGTNAIEKLKQDGYVVLVIEQTTESQSLQDFIPVEGARYAIIFGNEVNGVNDELLKLADGAIEIPQSGTKHSLNVSVCLGIVVWEIFRKHYHAGK